MKRKVGELYNVPIVEGDPNLLKSNEILHKGGGQLSKRNNTGKIEDLGNSGGGSQGETQDTFEYFINGKGDVALLLAYAQRVKIESVSAGLKAAMPYCIGIRATQEQFSDSEIIAFGVNLKEKTVMKMGDSFQDATVMEAIKSSGLTDADIAAIPRITKEEFYNLEA